MPALQWLAAGASIRQTAADLGDESVLSREGWGVGAGLFRDQGKPIVDRDLEQFQQK